MMITPNCAIFYIILLIKGTNMYALMYLVHNNAHSYLYCLEFCMYMVKKYSCMITTYFHFKVHFVFFKAVMLLLHTIYFSIYQT